MESESVVARSLWEKYLNSLKEEESSGLTASIPREFRDIQAKLEQNSSFSTTNEFVSPLRDLNDALDEWRVSVTQRKGFKKVLRKPDFIRRKNKRLSDIKNRLDGLLNPQVPGSSSSLILDPTNSNHQVPGFSSSLILDPTDSPWERFTFDSHPSESSEIMGFGKHVNEMVRWLSSSGEGFKAIGVYGMGGTGKTTLVRKVLQNPTVRRRFKHIIWACLSDLTSEDEIDNKIVEYLLFYIGHDVDSFAFSRNVSPMEQLKLKLLKLGNYIVVFDDVWVCNEFLYDLCHQLGEPKKMDPKLELDGAVIVTSRIMEVAEKMVDSEEKLIHLNPSDNYKENDEFLKGIVKQNMVDASNANMVSEIVRRCHGLPQAAKTLADVVDS